MEDLLNYFEGLTRSVNIGVEYEIEWAFDLACLGKKRMVTSEQSLQKYEL